MPNYNAILNITNSFNAATKLKEMNIGDMRSGNAVKNLYQSPELLGKALKTVAQHSPSSYRKGNNINNRIDKGTLYLSTYQELSSKIRNAKADGFRTNDILDMARVIKPIMPNTHQIKIEKLLKIFEIINSN